MIIFYCFFCCLSAVAILTVCFDFKKKQKLFFYLLAVIALSLLAGLRYDNADYKAYEEMFFAPWELCADKGFALLITLVKAFVDIPFFMFLVVAFLAVGLNISSFRKYSPYLFVSILFYFVHSFILKEYVQIRAGLSCAICLYAVRYINNRNIRKYILCMVIAIPIHMSSIIFFPMYWIYYFMINKKENYILYFLLFSFIVGTLYPFGQILKTYAPFLGETSRIATYANWEQFNKEIGILTNLTTVKQIFLCILCYIYRIRLNNKIHCFLILYLAYVLSTCWLMVFNDFVIVGARMATFLSVGEPVLFAGVLGLFSKQSRVIVLSVFIFIAYNILNMNFHTKPLGEYEIYPFNSLF